MITLKVKPKIREWNKDLCPEYDKLEAKKFKTPYDVNMYLMEHWGSTMWCYVDVFVGEVKTDQWSLYDDWKKTQRKKKK